MKKSKQIKKFFRNWTHRRKQQAELVRKRSSSTAATAMEELQPPPPPPPPPAIQPVRASGFMNALALVRRQAAASRELLRKGKIDAIVEQSGQRCRKELKSYFSRTSCTMAVAKQHLPNDKPDCIVIESVNKEDARDCAICWEKYREGDQVVWSSRTRSCKHIFHEACVSNFVVNHERRRRKLHSSASTLTAEGYENSQDEGPEFVPIRIPCPICREQYIRHNYEEDLQCNHHRNRQRESDDNDEE